jgi:hypothetical protein
MRDEERHGYRGGGSSVAGVREDAAEDEEGIALGWRRAAHSPVSPSCHLHGSRSCSMDLARVRERIAGSTSIGGSRSGRSPGALRQRMRSAEG